MVTEMPAFWDSETHLFWSWEPVYEIDSGRNNSFFNVRPATLQGIDVFGNTSIVFVSNVFGNTSIASTS